MYVRVLQQFCKKKKKTRFNRKIKISVFEGLSSRYYIIWRVYKFFNCVVQIVKIAEPSEL